MATISAPTSHGPSTTNTDGKFPATNLVDSIYQDSKNEQLKTLQRITNLAIPVAGKTAKPDSIEATIEQVLAHGETAKFFAKSFRALSKDR